MDREHKRLLCILREDVKAAPSGMIADSLASHLGKSYSTLMNELNDAIPTHKLGLLDGLEVISLCDSEASRYQIARILGGMFVRLPDVVDGTCESQKQALQAVQEFGEVITAYNEAAADHVITADELVHIEKEGHEALTAIQSFIESVRCEVKAS
ncbi:phage regulatory CII family protein [Desulfobaculum senezii]